MIKDSRDMFISDHIQEEDIMTCLVDKIIDGISMFLSEPAPSLAGVGLKLASQAAKGVEDNINLYHRRGRRGSGYVAKSLLGEHSQHIQSFQTSRVVGTRQRRLDPHGQRDDLESVKEENPRSAIDLRQTQKTWTCCASWPNAKISRRDGENIYRRKLVADFGLD